jgi:hypothetical protein
VAGPVPSGLAEQRPVREAIWQACHVGVWWSGEPARLQSGGLVGLWVMGSA